MDAVFFQAFRSKIQQQANLHVIRFQVQGWRYLRMRIQIHGKIMIDFL